MKFNLANLIKKFWINKCDRSYYVLLSYLPFLVVTVIVFLIFILLGGSIGAFIAYRIPMTAMPELVAGFHSLVGLAAVFVAISAFLNPEAFNLGTKGNIKLGSLIEMSIGAAVGAITFSGSIIAFLKLQGIMSGSPIVFKGQHPLNAIILISIVVLIYLLCASQSSNLFWILLAVSFLIGFLLIIPIGVKRWMILALKFISEER